MGMSGSAPAVARKLEVRAESPGSTRQGYTWKRLMDTFSSVSSSFLSLCLSDPLQEEEGGAGGIGDTLSRAWSAEHVHASQRAKRTGRRGASAC